MTSLVVLMSIVFKAASILSSSDQPAAFISHAVDLTTKTMSQTDSKKVQQLPVHINGPGSNSQFASMPLTLNMAMSGGRERSLTSSKRTFIPSMSVGSKSNHFYNHNPDVLPKSKELLDLIIDSHHNDDITNNIEARKINNRRSFISKLAAACLTTSYANSVPAFAAEIPSDDSTENSSTLFTRIGKGYEYSFLPPSGFKSNNKPLKTHLDEINFSLEGVRGYQYGITVDPVRIESLQQFGTPDQVATRVVDAEAARDGVTNVELVGTPTEDSDTGLYLIDYISTGSRGIKHFVTRIAVKKGHLYVLTAQVKEDNFKEYEKELLETVKTFQVP